MARVVGLRECVARRELDRDAAGWLRRGPRVHAGADPGSHGETARDRFPENAPGFVRDHTAHLVVTVSAERSELDLHILLTKVIAALLASCRHSLAVYWTPAVKVIARKTFIESAVSVLPKGPPVMLWIEISVWSPDERSTAAYTTGLAALGHREFEVKTSPESVRQLRGRLEGLCVYVLRNGPVIKGGHTIGHRIDERIEVLACVSSFGQKGQVMRLHYDEDFVPDPWWKFW